MDHQEIESKNSIKTENEELIQDSVIESKLTESNEINNEEIKNETTIDAPSIFEQQLSELQNKYLLLAADFENYRKRSLKQIEEIKNYSLESIIKELLEVIDNLERAINSSQNLDSNSNTNNSLINGIINVKKQFVTIIGSYGVSKINTSIGSDFNPHFHEAIKYIQSNKQNDGIILTIVKDGYLIHSKVIRPTSVIISKNEL